MILFVFQHCSLQRAIFLNKLLMNAYVDEAIIESTQDCTRTGPSETYKWSLVDHIWPPWARKYIFKCTKWPLTFSAFSRKYRDIFANDFRDIWEHDSIFFSSMKGVTLNVLNDASWRNKFGVEHKNSIKDQLGTQNGMFSL